MKINDSRRLEVFIQKKKTINVSKDIHVGLQIYGGPGSLSHDLKIWPITFQGNGPSGPSLFSCEQISL